MTAGIDLALALAEADVGGAVALEVARRLVLFLRRPGDQAQFSLTLLGQAAAGRRLRELQVWVQEHLADALTVPALARRAGMSQRHFARVFTREVGCMPARYVARARVEAARRLLEATEFGVERVAAACGFASAEVMRRAFRDLVGVGPQQYRQHFATRATSAPAARDSAG